MGTYDYSGYHIYQATVAHGFALKGVSRFPANHWGGAEGRSFYRDGVISMLGGGELVLRDALAPDSDVVRVPAQ